MLIAVLLCIIRHVCDFEVMAFHNPMLVLASGCSCLRRVVTSSVIVTVVLVIMTVPYVVSSAAAL